MESVTEQTLTVNLRTTWSHGITHFISILVNQDHIKNNFQNFKTEVLSNCENGRDRDESSFQTESLLYLTVGTMALLDEKKFLSLVSKFKFLEVMNK